jgi:hypothetical protein
MKKLSTIVLILISFNISYANFKLDINKTELKDTFKINQINFSRGGNPLWDTGTQLIEKNQYTIIINRNGNAQLKWNGKCPMINTKSFICSYSGNITKSQFKMLSKKLNEINFTELKEEYVKNIDDRGTESYIITYNNDKQKRIIDEDFEVDGLKELREMLIKLKNEIKWVPNPG